MRNISKTIFLTQNQTSVKHYSNNITRRIISIMGCSGSKYTQREIDHFNRQQEKAMARTMQLMDDPTFAKQAASMIQQMQNSQLHQELRKTMENDPMFQQQQKMLLQNMQNNPLLQNDPLFQQQRQILVKQMLENPETSLGMTGQNYTTEEAKEMEAENPNDMNTTSIADQMMQDLQK